MPTTSPKLERIVERLMASGELSSVDILLECLGSGRSELLRLAAIPHAFNVPILEAMVPDLPRDEAEAEYDRLGRLSMMLTAEAGKRMSARSNSRHNRGKSKVSRLKPVRSQPSRNVSRLRATWPNVGKPSTSSSRMPWIRLASAARPGCGKTLSSTRCCALSVPSSIAMWLWSNYRMVM